MIHVINIVCLASIYQVAFCYFILYVEINSSTSHDDTKIKLDEIPKSLRMMSLSFFLLFGEILNFLKPMIYYYEGLKVGELPPHESELVSC